MFQQYSSRHSPATDDPSHSNDVERHRAQPHQQPMAKPELSYSPLGAGAEMYYGNAPQPQPPPALPPVPNPILSALNKPKVLSPAPLKMYGKPESLSTGQPKIGAEVGTDRVQSVHEPKFSGMNSLAIVAYPILSLTPIHRRPLLNRLHLLLQSHHLPTRIRGSSQRCHRSWPMYAMQPFRSPGRPACITPPCPARLAWASRCTCK